MKDYSIETAVEQLKRCGVRVGDKSISVSPSNPPGLRALGAIDYLKKHGFIVERG